MRPVSRGSATNYTPTNYVSAADINQAVQFLQHDAQIAKGGQTFKQICQQQAADVKKTLKAVRNIGYVNPKNSVSLPADLASLDALSTTWSKDFANLVPIGSGATNQVVLTTAQNLISVLSALITSYDSTCKKYTQRIAKVYVNARYDLITNIGQYCSYCEMPLAASLAVEHMLPKAWFPEYSTEWANFLLACPICNSIKNDQPNLADSIAATGIALPTLPQITSAALGLYLWPSDATSYPNFDTAFQYQLWKVVYDSSGKKYQERSFTSTELQAVVWQGRLQKIGQTGGDIKAQVLTPLFTISSQPVLQFLNAIPPSGIAITNANVANVPQNLVQSFQSFINNDLPDMGKNFYVKLGADPNVQLKPIAGQPGHWNLTQTSTYLTRYYNGQVSLLAADGTLIHQWQTGPSTSIWRILNADNLPSEIATVIGVDQFSVSLTITFIQRGSYQMDITKKYELVNDSGILKVYADQVFSLEYRLAPATALFPTPPIIGRATRSIDNIDLNKIVSTDIKQSDRRLARRTNVFLNALETVQSFNAALKLQAQYPKIINDLGLMVIQTVQLSGFWTVWYFVFARLLTSNAPLQGQLLLELKKTSNFPGTR